MGLPRSEEDHPAGAVAPQGRRRRLRGAERSLGRPGHHLRRRLRLGRLRPPRRSQQDHRRILLQRSGAMRHSRRLVFAHRFLKFSNFVSFDRLGFRISFF